MSKLWEKISTIGGNVPPEKSESKEAVAQPGDKVMHRASGAHGVVTAVETIGGTPTLSVECANGRMLRGLDRKEFAFAGRGGVYGASRAGCCGAGGASGGTDAEDGRRDFW